MDGLRQSEGNPELEGRRRPLISPSPNFLPMHDPGSTCTNAKDTILFASGLRKTYSGRAVVDGVSITVKPREIVGLLGPNGAGKTTSFYMIAGLVPPDAGSVSRRRPDEEGPFAP